MTDALCRSNRPPGMVSSVYGLYTLRQQIYQETGANARRRYGGKARV